MLLEQRDLLSKAVPIEERQGKNLWQVLAVITQCAISPLKSAVHGLCVVSPLFSCKRKDIVTVCGLADEPP